MTDKKEKQIHFTDVGANDHLPYPKAEIVKTCRVSDNFAFSFYQIDYQAMAFEVSKGKGSKGQFNNFLVPVGKVVIDKATFMQFYKEISTLKETIDNESSEDEEKKG